MKACRDVITVWNRTKTDGKEKFYRTVIPVKCKWDNENSVAQIAGSKMTYPVSVIIPYCEQYVCEQEWEKLEDKAGYFTVKKGDIIALGERDIDITGIKPNTLTEVKARLAPECVEIKAYTDNTRLEFGKHIKAEGA